MNDKREMVRAMYDKVTGASDMDWSEIAEHYESGLHPDHLRKMGAGVKLVAEAGMLALQDQAAVNDTNDIQKLRDLRNEINEAYRAKSRSEALRDAVVRAVQSMPAIQIHDASQRAPVGNRTLVLCIADCHFGAEWTVYGLRGETLNHYDPEVFCERMDEL